MPDAIVCNLVSGTQVANDQYFLPTLVLIAKPLRLHRRCRTKTRNDEDQCEQTELTVFALP